MLVVLSLGYWDLISAATPATYGDAKEVPLPELTVLFNVVDNTLSPGAAKVTSIAP